MDVAHYFLLMNLVALLQEMIHWGFVMAVQEAQAQVSTRRIIQQRNEESKLKTC